MFDYKTMTYQGEHVSYATMPMYVFKQVNQHPDLTPAAKNLFFVLMAYASSVNSCQFKITNKWLEENTSLTDKTVTRALKQLRVFGFVNEEGIVYGKPPANQLRATSTTARAAVAQQQKRIYQNDASSVQITQNVTTPVPSVQVNHFPDATKMVDSTDISAQANAMLASLGIRKKVVIADTKTQDNFSNTPENVHNKNGIMSAPIITIPNNTLLKNTPTESAEKPAAKKPTQPNEKSGLLFSASQKGFVEKTQPKPLASFVPKIGAGSTVVIGKPLGSLSQQHTSYIATALGRMNVTSPSERKRYTDEIAYAATKGAFAQTYRHTPLKAIRACLNLVESGKWRANGGMY
jgi:hypothetical protein